MEKRLQMSRLHQEVLQQHASLLQDSLTLRFVEKFSRSHKKLQGNRDLAGDGDERAFIGEFLAKLLKSDDINFQTFLGDLDSCGLGEVKDKLEKTLAKLEESRKTLASRTGRPADMNRPNMDVRDIIQHLATAVEDLTVRVSILQEGKKGGNSSHSDHHDDDDDVVHSLELALVKKEEEVELYKELLEKERAERLRGEEEIARLVSALDVAKAEIAELRKVIARQGKGIKKQEKELRGLHTQTDKLSRDMHSMQKQMKEISAAQASTASTPAPEEPPSPVSPPPAKPPKLPPMADKPADPKTYVPRRGYQPVPTKTPRAGERKVEETLKEFNLLKKKNEAPKEGSSAKK